jgi:hypothetical protein
MAVSELAGKELFDELSELLREIRRRAEATGDAETSRDADKADVLLRNFGVAVGDQVAELKTVLILNHKLVLNKADAALRGYHKAYEAQRDLEDITVEAIRGIEIVLEKWP